ncbi:MAG: TRAP transporter small permease [Deltaproteobacteria bacterium]|nr:TRAP transporter small permease [Deltaproteobacteria bacterium]
MGGLQKLAVRLTGAMDMVAAATLVFMMFLTVTDVVLRYLGHPFMGAYEVVAFGGAVAIAFAMPRTSLVYHNIAVEFLTDQLGKGVRRWLSLFTRSLGIGLFILLGYGLINKGLELYRGGEVTPGLQVIFYPIAFGLALCAFVESVVLFFLMIREFITGEFAGGGHE